MFSNLSKVSINTNDPVNMYQLYQGSRYLVSLILSVILVRCGLSSIDVGHFELLIFITTTFSFFWAVGMQSALLSYFPSTKEADRTEVLQTVFIVLLSIGIIGGLMILFFPGMIGFLFKGGAYIPFLPVASIYLILSSPLLMIENILLMKKKSNELIFYTFLSLSVTLVPFIFMSMYAPDVENFLYVLIGVSFLRISYLIYLLEFYRSVRISIKKILKWLKFSLPLVLTMLIGSAMDFVDGWFVSTFYDTSDFAIFRFGARELPFSTVLYSSLSAAMIPFLVNGESCISELKAKATKLMHLLFPLSILLIFVSPILFEYIYSKEFRASAYIFNIYLLILTSRVLLPQTYNFAKNQHKVILWTGIFELCMNVALSYWWMHIWGIYGLAFATVVAYFVQKLLLIIYNKLKNDIDYNSYVDFKYYVFYTFVSLFAVYFTFKYY